MKEEEVRDRAFAMPLTQPAYARGPYRFVDREHFIITYRTDSEKLRALVPAPLEIEAPLVPPTACSPHVRPHNLLPQDASSGECEEALQAEPGRYMDRGGKRSRRARRGIGVTRSEEPRCSASGF